MLVYLAEPLRQKKHVLYYITYIFIFLYTYILFEYMGADRKCKPKNYERAWVFQHRLLNPASRLISDWLAIETNMCHIRIDYCKRRKQYYI